MTTDRIDLSLRTTAPPERVWRAWTDPVHLTRWLPDRARGEATAGRSMVYEWEALGMSLALEVLEAEPPSRLVLRASSPALGVQTQRISITPDRRGSVVSLVHTGLADDDIRAGTESGWRISLQLLKRYLEQYYDLPRVSAWILGLARGSFANAFALYTRHAGLEKWLASSGSFGTTGTAFELELLDGGRMTGQVLARTEGREIALSWDEIDGVVALRTFAAAPGALLVGANLSSWGRSEAELEPAARALEASVDRLVRALGSATASA